MSQEDKKRDLDDLTFSGSIENLKVQLSQQPLSPQNKESPETRSQIEDNEEFATRYFKIEDDHQEQESSSTNLSADAKPAQSSQTQSELRDQPIAETSDDESGNSAGFQLDDELQEHKDHEEDIPSEIEEKASFQSSSSRSETVDLQDHSGIKPLNIGDTEDLPPHQSEEDQVQPDSSIQALHVGDANDLPPHQPEEDQVQKEADKNAHHNQKSELETPHEDASESRDEFTMSDRSIQTDTDLDLDSEDSNKETFIPSSQSEAAAKDQTFTLTQTNMGLSDSNDTPENQDVMNMANKSHSNAETALTPIPSSSFETQAVNPPPADLPSSSAAPPPSYAPPPLAKASYEQATGIMFEEDGAPSGGTQAFQVQNSVAGDSSWSPIPHSMHKESNMGDLTRLQQFDEQAIDNSYEQTLYTYNPADESPPPDDFAPPPENSIQNIIIRFKQYVENNKKNVVLIGVAVLLLLGSFFMMTSNLQEEIPLSPSVPQIAHTPSTNINTPSESNPSPSPSTSNQEQKDSTSAENTTTTPSSSPSSTVSQTPTSDDPRLNIDSTKSLSDPVDNFFNSLNHLFNNGDPRSVAQALNKAPKQSFQGEKHRLFVAETSARFFLLMSEPQKAIETLEPYCYAVTSLNGPYCIHYIRALISNGDYKKAHALLGSALTLAEDISSQWNLVKKEVEMMKFALFSLYSQSLNDVLDFCNTLITIPDLPGEWAQQRSVWLGRSIFALSSEKRSLLSHSIFVAKRAEFQKSFTADEHAFQIGQDQILGPLLNYLAYENEMKPFEMIGNSSETQDSKVYALSELLQILTKIHTLPSSVLVSIGRQMKQYPIFREALALIQSNVSLDEGNLDLVKKIIDVHEIINIKTNFTNNPDILSYEKMEKEKRLREKKQNKQKSNIVFSLMNYFDFVEKKNHAFPLEWILIEARFAIDTKIEGNLLRSEEKIIKLLNQDSFLYVFDLWILLAQIQRLLKRDPIQSIRNARQLAKTPREIGFVLAEEMRYYARSYLRTDREGELIEMLKKANDEVPYHMELHLTTAEILSQTKGFDAERFLESTYNFPTEYLRRGMNYGGLQTNTLKAIFEHM